MENVNTELTQADNTVQQDPATTAALLEQEIMAELQAGALQLKDGLPFGIGADCVMQYAVTFRELTTGDVIDAQTASEIPVTTAEGQCWSVRRPKWASRCCAAVLRLSAASTARCL